jgi:hypothetical protein
MGGIPPPGGGGGIIGGGYPPPGGGGGGGAPGGGGGFCIPYRTLLEYSIWTRPSGCGRMALPYHNQRLSIRGLSMARKRDEEGTY